MDMADRSHFNLEKKVREAFVFLSNLGFSEIESLPTLVRYQNGGIEVDIYHGRQSYEIGAGISVFGARYSISEIIQASDPGMFKQFRYAMTTTPEGVTSALEELSLLMNRYANTALEGDQKFIMVLEKQRKQWSEDYALDVLAKQLRPKASEAFRQKDYSTATDLYSRIRKCLSTAELKKLDFSIKHSKTAQ
ncbi:hypothetical protein BMR02_11550 [Methylococcaceae bacterium HT1]|nr:hypothetical protein BMR02_11550 [Methylococcaceae bacterium HT1]TXL12854.1 hypothetical protein BMR05_14025 [Methylococcaceae bacterium HT4]TXL13046.1 hypothetical protein BMR04_14700 [Methylococcaceae bacterium HT3]TXL18406.1 hypothetical protein BMR06_13745 [Methylococcaceae bacterium HT5]TXL20164.1 hypothetical protein BMR03_14660 [Methylococcaceae bacterium HT2]